MSLGYNFLTGGSRATFSSGMATVEAARSIIKQCCGRAAKLWEIPEEAVSFEDGEFRLRFLDRGVEERQFETDLIDLLAIGTEVLFGEGQGLNVFAPGELHTVGLAMSLGGGEAVLELGQFGLFARF